MGLIEYLFNPEKKAEQEKEWSMAYLKQGELFEKNGKGLDNPDEKYRKALSAYDTATKKNQNNVLAWIKKGNLLVKMNRLEQACVAYNQAILIDPKNSFALEEKYKNYCKTSQDKITTINAILDIDPQNDKWWIEKARQYPYDNKEALFALEKSILYNTESWRLSDLWSHKADILQELGQKEESLAAYNQVISLNPHYDAKIFVKKAKLLENLNRQEEALETYELALITHGDKPDKMFGHGSFDSVDVKKRIFLLQKQVKPKSSNDGTPTVFNISGRKIHIGDNKTEIKDSVLTRSNVSTDCEMEDSICPDCGEDVSQDKKFCGNCGTRVR